MFFIFIGILSSDIFVGKIFHEENNYFSNVKEGFTQIPNNELVDVLVKQDIFLRQMLEFGFYFLVKFLQ